MQSYVEAIKIAEEREAAVKQTFQKYDLDKSDSIDMDELRNVLKVMEIRLTEGELNYLLFKLDFDGDGVLSMDEFVPMAFQMLVQVVAEMREWEGNLEYE